MKRRAAHAVGGEMLAGVGHDAPERLPGRPDGRWRPPRKTLDDTSFRHGSEGPAGYSPLDGAEMITIG